MARRKGRKRMMSIDEMEALLEKIAEEVPEPFFRELNEMCIRDSVYATMFYGMLRWLRIWL